MIRVIPDFSAGFQIYMLKRYNVGFQLNSKSTGYGQFLVHFQQTKQHLNMNKFLHQCTRISQRNKKKLEELIKIRTALLLIIFKVRDSISNMDKCYQSKIKWNSYSIIVEFPTFLYNLSDRKWWGGALCYFVLLNPKKDGR